MLLLKKNKRFFAALPWEPFTAYSITVDPSHHYKLTRRISLGFSTTATTTQEQSPQTPFIVEFLVKSCGLSPLQATKASKSLTHLKSTSKPEKVVHFFKECGWTDAQIGKCVTLRPTVLRSNVEKTLKPKLQSLRELGFSRPEVIQLASGNPAVLQVRNLRPRIEFWRAMFCSTEKLLKALKREPALLGYCIDKKIKPNLSLLKECGISDSQLPQLVLNTPRIVLLSIDALKAILSRVDTLGIPRGSGMYFYGVRGTFCIGESKTEEKFKFLLGLGFTEAEIRSAVRRFPLLFTLSHEKILRSMEFLLNEVGCSTSFLARYADLLAMSLEKRLVPRHKVLKLLKAKGLLRASFKVGNFFRISEAVFLEKYVFSYHDNVPGLLEAYLAACSKEAPV